MLEQRLIFLHFLFIETSYDSVVTTSVDILNSKVNEVLGNSPSQRKMFLAVVYNKYIKCLPNVKCEEKKKSTFKMTRV